MLLVAGILVHAGLFARVEIHEKQMGPYLTVYKLHVGGYHKINKIIDEFDKILGQEEKIEAGLSFGHYFDNPFEGTTKIKDLKSHVGVIINSMDTLRLSEIIAHYKIKSEVIPKATYLMVELPFKSEFSKITGPLKVYSSLKKHLNNYNLKMQSLIEIFDYENSVLIYMSPLPEDLH